MTQTPHTAVTLERLAQLLDAYGGEPARWPDAERAGALQLIASAPEAAALQRAALELDGALNLQQLPESADAADAQLRARVLEIPIRHARELGSQSQQQRGWSFGRRRNWAFALFALTPCVLGFLSGTLLMDPAGDSDDDAWDELAQVVMPVQLADELDMFDEETP